MSVDHSTRTVTSPEGRFASSIVVTDARLPLSCFSISIPFMIPSVEFACYRVRISLGQCPFFNRTPQYDVRVAWLNDAYNYRRREMKCEAPPMGKCERHACVLRACVPSAFRRIDEAALSMSAR
ncbi:hypothetical protein BN2476_320006 [Paraburkholderia piptadeniae]|uniref:Uncharacterized protein n=1 Tax=Paraburkholderia piptadeniae TaxID=1701573 RepID=A0A1N7S4B0_9BURK|nr:hypothetical protein BN2476_320006 [Paraburkholderia piptadeniae]